MSGSGTPLYGYGRWVSPKEIRRNLKLTRLFYLQRDDCRTRTFVKRRLERPITCRTQRNGRASSSLTLAILSCSLKLRWWKSGLTVTVGCAAQAWLPPPLFFEGRPDMATGCFKSWKISTSFHTPLPSVPVRLAKNEQEVLPRLPEPLATHTRFVLR